MIGSKLVRTSHPGVLNEISCKYKPAVAFLDIMLDLFVCLFGSLTSSSTTRLYRGRAPRQSA